MARRYFRKLALLAKIEAAYGEDAAPTGAANAILASNVTVAPLEGEQVSRDLMLPYYGDQGFVLTAVTSRIEFDVELAGAGAAGAAPAYAPLLRACGLAEVLTVGTKAEYKPVSASQEAASLYANLDGVNHVLLGARGTLTINLAPKQIPKIRFTLTGLLGPIADVALPAANHAAFQKPLVASKANSSFALHGLTVPMESLAFDLGNQVESRMLVGWESIEITDRKSSGTAVIEAVAIATKDWFAAVRNAGLGAMEARHGPLVGNIVEIAAAAVQIGKPTYGNSQGILNTSLPLVFTPVLGDDEVTLRIR